MGARGKPKDPGSGRKKGTLNKNTQDLFEICERHNINVFESMVILAVKETDESEQFSRLTEIAKYLYAKRKEVEHSGSVEAIKLIIEDYSSKK